MKYIPTEQLLTTELLNIHHRVTKTHHGFSSGYPVLDNDLMGGFQNGYLYCVASVGGMGKTMVALNILVNQLKNLAPNEVLVFVSTHTSYPVLIQKLLAIATGIELRKIQGGDLTTDELSMLESHPFLTLLKTNQLVLVENNAPTFEDMNETINALMAAGKQPKMLFIDCLQDMQVPNENTNREQAIYTLLKSISVMAERVQLPVLFTSKVSKRVFYRKESQVPKLEDLLHSRFIGQVADYVYMVLRPNYYEVPNGPDYSDITEDMHLYCRKNKHLPLDILVFSTELKKHQVTIAPTYTITDDYSAL